MRGATAGRRAEPAHPGYGASAASDGGHDVWRNRAGLGKTARNVWHALLAHAAPVTVTIVHQETGSPTPSSVRRALKSLAAVGLAVRVGHYLWRGVVRNLDEVAAELGAAGRGEIQREQHEQERLGYHAARKARAAEREQPREPLCPYCERALRRSCFHERTADGVSWQLRVVPPHDDGTAWVDAETGEIIARLGSGPINHIVAVYANATASDIEAVAS